MIRFLMVLITLLILRGAYAQDNNVAEVNYLTWEELDEAMKKEPRKVYVKVFTTWCGWCKQMDKTTMVDPEVVSYLNEHYYAVHWNAEHMQPSTFSGKEYQPSGRTAYGRKVPHDLTYVLYGDDPIKYPTNMFFTEELEKGDIILGYIDAQRLLAKLKAFNEQDK